jgi:hypothetical protein
MNNREQNKKNENRDAKFMITYKPLHYIDIYDLQYQYKKFTNKNS